jgi:AcrR family transcriptional regulator
MPQRPRARKDQPRRSKSSRETLNRGAVFQAALDVADEDGFAALTIRKLAATLGVTPMAIYRHCRSKEEITDGIVDLVVGQSAPTRHEHEDWREWLRETLSIMRAALRAHPGVIPLLGTPAGFGPNALRVLNDMLRVLLDAGLPGPRAIEAVYRLLSYTVGSAAIVNAARRPGRKAGAIETGRWFRGAVDRYPGERDAELPTLSTLLPYLDQFASDEQFQHGLDRMIAALEEEITATSRARRRR